MPAKRVQPKQRPVAIFDIDGTIFRNSLLIELHWKMVKTGIVPKNTIAKLDKRYWAWVRRAGTYDDYLMQVIESFNEFIAGVPVKTVQDLARSVVKIQSEIVYRYSRDLIEKLRKTHTLVAVSGSPEIVVAEFARAWKFNYYIGTRHAEKDGWYTGGEAWVASANKEEALRRLQEKHGFVLGKGSVGVGDTESDIKIFKLVDKPICINPTSGLYKVAEKEGWLTVVERKDTIYEIKSGKVRAYGRK